MPPVCAAGGASRGGGRFASFHPSAFPAQATKLVSLASFGHGGRGPHTAPVRARPPSLGAICAASWRVGAGSLVPGGWGGGAGRALAPLPGGGRGDHPLCLGAVRAGAPAACGPVGGVGGGGVALRPPCSPSGGRHAVPYPGPPLVLGALPPGVRVWLGSGGRPGVVMGGVMGGAAPILFWCAAVCRPKPWSTRRSGALVWACPSAATPAGAGGWGRWGARCAHQPHPPLPRRGPFWGRGSLLWPSSLGGSRGGGGLRRRPPPPCRASACPPLSPARPPGVYSCRERRARPGQPPVGQCGGGGEGGAGNPPALVRAPAFPRPASEGAAPFAPSWAPPVRRRSAAGRAGPCGRFTGGACRGRGAPSAWVQGPLRGGCRGAISLVCLRPLFSLRGGGGVGGGLWSQAPPPDSRGGAAWQSRPQGPAVCWGVVLFPRPPLHRARPSCRPSLGSLVPPAVAARRWPA